MSEGVSPKPFSATTLPPHIQSLQSYKDIIIKNTREHYAVPRKIVDERIASEWNGQSDAIINDKLGRRDEKSLSQVLRPGGAAGAGRDASALPRDRYMPPRTSSGPSSMAPRATSSPASSRPTRTTSYPASTPAPAPSSTPAPTPASAPASRETPVVRPIIGISNSNSISNSASASA